MMRAALAGLVFSLPAIAHAQAAAPADYHSQAMGQEIFMCVGQKIAVSTDLLAANAKIADLEKQIAKMATATSPPVADSGKPK